MKWTLEQFQKLDIGSIFPLHCTGFEAAFLLQRHFPNRVAMPGAGETVELN
jgi:metal-dependent hydrolase (beta-lactamase superfamily II)